MSGTALAMDDFLETSIRQAVVSYDSVRQVWELQLWCGLLAALH